MLRYKIRCRFFAELFAGLGGAGVTGSISGIIAVGGSVLGRRVATGTSRRTSLGGAFAADTVPGIAVRTISPPGRISLAVTVGQSGSVARRAVLGDAFGTVLGAGLAVHFAVISGTAGFAGGISGGTGSGIAAEIFTVARSPGENISGIAGSIFIRSGAFTFITGKFAEVMRLLDGLRGSTGRKEVIGCFTGGCSGIAGT